MKNRKVFIYSDTRDYLTKEHTKKVADTNATLLKGNKKSFKNFIKANEGRMLQLDTETNVVDHYIDRELYVVQLGDIDQEEQHIFDIKDIEPGGKIDKLLLELFKSEFTFIAHNAGFEYMMIHKHWGVDVKNFKDTMLAARLITAGLELPKGSNSLAGILASRFGIDVSKAAQTSFTGEMMDPEQLIYAVTDVLYLYMVLKSLYPPMKRWGLLKTFKLENKCLRAIADFTINGCLIDRKALDENIDIFEKNAASSKAEMIKAFKAETDPEKVKKIEELNVVQKYDEIIINWNSSVQKKLILNYLCPDVEITSTAKAGLVKLEKTMENPRILTMYLNGKTEKLEEILISKHMQFLIDNDLMIKAGNLNINFNSNQQLLAFFRIWYPKLSGVGVKDLKKIKHPVINGYKKYSKDSKLVSSFGRGMYEFIESDGRIRSSFNQLVPSGSRMSSSKPNVQQAPSTEQYRRIYIPTPGWKLIDSDYA